MSLQLLDALEVGCLLHSSLRLLTGILERSEQMMELITYAVRTEYTLADVAIPSASVAVQYHPLVAFLLDNLKLIITISPTN